jgi:hypothetical protein
MLEAMDSSLVRLEVCLAWAWAFPFPLLFLVALVSFLTLKVGNDLLLLIRLTNIASLGRGFDGGDAVEAARYTTRITRVRHCRQSL